MSEIEETARHGLSGLLVAVGWWLRERRRAKKDAYRALLDSNDDLMEEIGRLRAHIERLEAKIDTLAEENTQLRITLATHAAPSATDASPA